jgi:hypothetical protein
MKKANLISALVILLVLATVICPMVYHSKISSAEGLANYSEYRRNLPEPRTVRLLRKDNLEFVACYGPITTLALVSGPPLYVFDRSGKLVDWSRDIGDDGVYDDKWRPFEGETISFKEADALLGQKIRPK